MTTMRIAFFNLRAHGLFDPSNTTVFGGAEVQLYHLSTGLAARGHEVTFITRGPGPKQTRVVEGVYVKKLPLRTGSFGKIVTLAESLFSLLTSKSDVIVQRCAGIETALLAAAARLTGARFCFMSASLLDCRDQLAREQKGWLYNVYLWGLRRANCVVCQNDLQRTLLTENFGIFASTLPSACAPVDDTPPDKTEDEQSKVLWIGRCDPYKDPRSFLRLVRELPDIPFRMIMPPGEFPSYQKEIEREAEGLPNLELREKVSFFEMDGVYRHASVLVNTSTLEGFPNTFMEAMRAAVPILSYRLDPGGVLETEGAGVCAHDDFQVLADLCRCWHEKPESARPYAEAGREYVRRTHDRRVVVEKFEEILYPRRTDGLPRLRPLE